MHTRYNMAWRLSWYLSTSGRESNQIHFLSIKSITNRYQWLPLSFMGIKIYKKIIFSRMNINIKP
jgi:hypothetical protein